MKTITLEEHFVTRSFLKATGNDGSTSAGRFAGMQPKLLDLDGGRIAAMDEAAIDFQVLSLACMNFDDLDAPSPHRWPTMSTTSWRRPSNATRRASAVSPHWP